MSLITDAEYLKADQYKTAGNLSARQALHARFSTNPYGWQRWVYDHLNLKVGEKVVEVGCGTARLWKDDPRPLPTGVMVALSDLSIGMLRAGRQDMPDSFAGYAGDMQAIPFKEGLFDCAIANHMLYHVPDIEQGVSEVARVLKPNGRALIATNGLIHLQELEKLIQEVLPGYNLMESTSRFGLDNGGKILRNHFTQVDLDLYEDALWITETRPLCEYISSLMGVKIALQPHLLEELAELIKLRIQRDGGIAIGKNSGLFICHKKVKYHSAKAESI